MAIGEGTVAARRSLRRRAARDGARPASSARSLLGRSGPWTREATVLAALVAALLVVGLLMSFSASFVDAAETTGDPFRTFRRQLLWAAVGVPLFLVTAAWSPRVWRGLSWPLLALALAGLVAVVIPDVGLAEGGSTRWLRLGPFVVQPSELAKLASLLWLADVLARKTRDDRPHTTAHLLVPAIPLLVVEATLVMLQPDLGTALLLALVVGLVLYAEGLPGLHVGLLGTAGILGAGLAAVAAPYRFARVTAWLQPEADPLETGYQLLQSLYAMGSGGWFGIGLGAGRAKWNFVPNPETDFIFAIVGEELGLVGSLTVLALFVALLVVGLRVARSAPDRFARTVAIAIVGWITGQALVNVGGVTGLLPITGVTLPLVSVGGSSLLVTLGALGILVAIARSGERTSPRRPTRRGTLRHDVTARGRPAGPSGDAA